MSAVPYVIQCVLIPFRYLDNPVFWERVCANYDGSPYSFLKIHVTSSLLGTDILLCTLFSNALFPLPLV